MATTRQRQAAIPMQDLNKKKKDKNNKVMKRFNITILLSVVALLVATLQVQAQYVEYSDQQGPQSVFVNPDVKQRLAQNAVTLREHLLHRRAALLQWQSLPVSELQPVTLRVQAVAKNRGGQRELRVRRFHYLGDCGYSHGGQDSGVDTPTTAQAVFASDLADSYLNQAALLGIPIDSLTIELHGRPDKEPTGRVYYPRNFLYTVYISTPASDAELNHLADLAEQNSPVVNFIKRPIDLTHDIDLKPSPKKHEVKGSTLAGLREYLQGKRQAQQASKKQQEELRKKWEAEQKEPQSERKERKGPEVRVLSNGVRELTVNEKYLILNDNPEYLGGSNTGMTSRENLLAVLATCITHITEGQAAQLNVPLDSLALSVEAQWDPRAGRPGFELVPEYPTNIHYTLHVSSPESFKRIEELLEAVEKICPMYNLFKDGPQTFERRIVRIGRES